MAKSAKKRATSATRRKADVMTAKREQIETVLNRAPKSLATTATVAESDVARRAYDLYLARGCAHGHDIDDWLQAERELHIDPEC